ncbi:DUF4373 domain-containing protein [Megasphaera sp. AM44-1BH]|uniref:Lin1244/Lin1753 domain-containing protein n=1 Tax=Megasphaera sp. AM44-1BH TaxID=2292358 RepID=UPI000E486D35|nr:Lin1244/Lin1753 domain-containing protein [Megasphaera sp. AM44-1BH]RHA11728.1 DUF4373 domain-containing protein [Megasphaera sp. AM44-1BH]
MARPTKQGLDYFPLDVGFLQNVKVRRIMRACGIQSIPVLISLLANTYCDEGYFLRWDSDMPFLIADELGVSEGAVTAVVDKATQVDFFNANMYQKYGVLTSDGIQKRFFEATARRTSVRYDARFLLINVSDYKNLVNVYKNSINDDSNEQSKVKESKVKKSSSTGGDGLTDVINAYRKNIYPMPGEMDLEKLKAMTADFGSDIVVKAINRAVVRNKRNLAYVHGILKRWQANGYDEEDARKHDPLEEQYDKIPF